VPLLYVEYLWNIPVKACHLSQALARSQKKLNHIRDKFVNIFGALNVVAHPHPKGTYRRIFEEAAELKTGVKYYSDRFAKISPLSKTREDVFTGRLATWSEVDRDENTIDTRSLEEQLFDDSGVVIPDGIGLNAKVFTFAFNEKTHTLIFETRNDLGQAMSINLALKAFDNIFSNLAIEGIDQIDIFVKTTADIVDRIFSIHSLRKVEIDLKLPNPDDLSDTEGDILRELEEMNSKRVFTQITKDSASESLEPTERYKAMANLAKDNGYVLGVGKDAEGHKVEMKTSQYPEEYRVYEDAEDSGVSAIRRIAGDA
tara:strand:+ start:172 stop:1113 length:942 start_codon:yes stop_codon:yes gene_type:complete